MSRVRCENQRLPKEQLLDFGLRNAMLLILSEISRIPVEADDGGQLHLIEYMPDIYKTPELLFSRIDLRALQLVRIVEVH